MLSVRLKDSCDNKAAVYYLLRVVLLLSMLQCFWPSALLAGGGGARELSNRPIDQSELIENFLLSQFIHSQVSQVEHKNNNAAHRSALTAVRPVFCILLLLRKFYYCKARKFCYLLPSTASHTKAACVFFPAMLKPQVKGNRFEDA